MLIFIDIGRDIIDNRNDFPTVGVYSEKGGSVKSATDFNGEQRAPTDYGDKGSRKDEQSEDGIARIKKKI